MLVCGINASSCQWCGWIFILCYTHLKLAFLLHKRGLVATGVVITVSTIVKFQVYSEFNKKIQKSKIRLKDISRISCSITLMDLLLEKYPQGITMLTFMFVSLEYPMMKKLFENALNKYFFGYEIILTVFVGGTMLSMVLAVKRARNFHRFLTMFYVDSFIYDQWHWCLEWH